MKNKHHTPTTAELHALVNAATEKSSKAIDEILGSISHSVVQANVVHMALRDISARLLDGGADHYFAPSDQQALLKSLNSLDNAMWIAEQNLSYNRKTFIEPSRAMLRRLETPDPEDGLQARFDDDGL